VAAAARGSDRHRRIGAATPAGLSDRLAAQRPGAPRARRRAALARIEGRIVPGAPGLADPPLAASAAPRQAGETACPMLVMAENNAIRHIRRP
jgi:hypothetical protein